MATGFMHENHSPHPNGTFANPLAASEDFVLATLGDAIEWVGLAEVAAALSAMVAVRSTRVPKRWSRKS